MRVKIQASPPLPEIKAWFSLSNLSPSSSVALLKHELCKTLSTLRESGVHGRDLILLLDDFELLGETSIDIIKDGDMIWYVVCIFTVGKLTFVQLADEDGAAKTKSRS